MTSVEPYVQSSCWILTRINNKNRKHTDCFIMAENGHYDMDLIVQLFKAFICDRMMNANDFYILLSLSLDLIFEPFQRSSRRTIIFQCDEDEQKMDNCQYGTTLYDATIHFGSKIELIHDPKNSEESKKKSKAQNRKTGLYVSLKKQFFLHIQQSVSST